LVGLRTFSGPAGWPFLPDDEEVKESVSMTVPIVDDHDRIRQGFRR
jgi:hypothetical protein